MKFSGIKLIAADIDGTLLKPDKSLDGQIKGIIKKLKEMGIFFTLVTGRNYALVKDLIELLAIDIPYVIDNGANIYLKDKALKAYYMREESAKFIVNNLLNEKIPFNIFNDEKGFSYLSSVKLADITGRLAKRMTIENINKIEAEDFKKVYKITLDAVNYPYVERLMAKVNTLLHDDVVFRRSEDSFYTVTYKDTSKGAALQEIALYLHVPNSGIMTFGDNFNDVSMFEISEIGVAMGNSSAEVKALADDIALTNAEDGLSKYLLEHLPLTL